MHSHLLAYDDLETLTHPCVIGAVELYGGVGGQGLGSRHACLIRVGQLAESAGRQAPVRICMRSSFITPNILAPRCCHERWRACVTQGDGAGWARGAPGWARLSGFSSSSGCCASAPSGTTSSGCRAFWLRHTRRSCDDAGAGRVSRDHWQCPAVRSWVVYLRKFLGAAPNAP